jgi:Zn-dependent metalloprotease
VALVATSASDRPLHAQARTTTIAATTGADLRSWDTRVTQMLRAGDLKVRRSDPDTLVNGRTHERLDQYYKGVRVYGADITRQLDGALTVSVFGAIHEDIDLDVTPALTAEDIVGRLARLTGVEIGERRRPELIVYPHDNQYVLAYHARVFTARGATEYFIDAKSGAVIATLDGLQRQSSAIGTAVGVLGDRKKMSATSFNSTFFADDPLRPPALSTFDLRGNLNRTLAFLNGVVGLTLADYAVDSDNDWSDGAAVDAHAYAGYVYDYYFKRFGRNGLDNQNIELLSIVHPVQRENFLVQSDEIFGTFYINAFYAGDGLMVYGEGLPNTVTLAGQRWNYMSGALDVVGHELTHGITDYSSQLIYAGESGALNESFSDMMGTAIEFFYQAPGTGPLQADYLCAEDIVTPGGIRSMANPALFGQPDHYSRRAILPIDDANDNGGVHINSGIGNQAYYLAIEGGTNRTSGLSVQGVGAANRDQIEKVMYRAFTQLMPANGTYAVARSATLQAARDLFGPNSAAERSLTQAWAAVGVN